MSDVPNTITVVIEEALEKRIKKVAEEQRRSTSAQICFALEEWLENKK